MTVAIRALLMCCCLALIAAVYTELSPKYAFEDLAEESPITEVNVKRQRVAKVNVDVLTSGKRFYLNFFPDSKMLCVLKKDKEIPLSSRPGKVEFWVGYVNNNPDELASMLIFRDGPLNLMVRTQRDTYQFFNVVSRKEEFDIVIISEIDMERSHKCSNCK